MLDVEADVGEEQAEDGTQVPGVPPRHVHVSLQTEADRKNEEGLEKQKYMEQDAVFMCGIGTCI